MQNLQNEGLKRGRRGTTEPSFETMLRAKYRARSPSKTNESGFMTVLLPERKATHRELFGPTPSDRKVQSSDEAAF